MGGAFSITKKIILEPARRRYKQKRGRRQSSWARRARCGLYRVRERRTPREKRLVKHLAGYNFLARLALNNPQICRPTVLPPGARVLIDADRHYYRLTRTKRVAGGRPFNLPSWVARVEVQAGGIG